MNTQRLKAVMEWLKTTDLVEVRYQEGPVGFALATAEAPAAAPPAGFASHFVPVCSPAVGLFQTGEPGRPRLGDEGIVVKEGDVLGIVDTGGGKPHAVKAPCPGRVARAFVDGGRPVQYGQPLFFLERSS